jgi:hypothetical protein
MTQAGDAAVREQTKSDSLSESAGKNIMSQVTQERMNSDSGKWSSAQRPEPKQLTFTDPYGDANSARAFLTNGSSGDCKIQSGSGSRPGDCNFKPDFEFKTEGGQKWKQDALKQNSKGLELNKDGSYDVQKGDSVWGLAERMARQASGRKPTANETHKEMTKLLEANKEKYPGLDCNPHMLRAGMKLDVPNAKERMVSGANRDSAVRNSGEKTESSQRADKANGNSGMTWMEGLNPQGMPKTESYSLTSEPQSEANSDFFNDDKIVMPRKSFAPTGDDKIIMPQSKNLPPTGDDKILKPQTKSSPAVDDKIVQRTMERDAIRRQQFEQTGVMGNEITTDLKSGPAKIDRTKLKFVGMPPLS